MSRVELTFDGSNRGVLTAAKGTIEAVEKVKKTTAETAAANVTKRAEERRSLEKLAGEYTRLAKTAKRGSEEQVAAAKLAQRSIRELSESHGVHSRALANSERELGRFTRGAVAGSGVMGHLGRSVAFASGMFLGGVGLIAVMRESVKGASALEVQLQRTEKTFGANAEAIKRWSESSAKSLGQTRSDALDTVNTIGTLLTNMGVAADRVARLSPQLAVRAADVASAKGISSDQVDSAFIAGISGRTRALKQLGIVIDQTAIKTEAERLGLVRNTIDLGKVRDANEQVRIAQFNLDKQIAKHGSQSAEAAKATVQLHNAQRLAEKAAKGHAEQLTNEQKALATTSALMQQTSNVAGNFARHSGNLAEQEKILHAEIGNLEEELGTALIPQLEKYLPMVTDWVDRNQKSGAIQRDLNSAVKATSEIVSGAFQVLRVAKSIFEGISKAVGGDKEALEILATFVLGGKFVGAMAGLAGNLGLIRTRAVAAETALAGEAGAAATGGLLGSLRALSVINPIVIPITLAVALQGVGQGDPLSLMALLQHGGSITDFLLGPKGHRGALGNLLTGTGKKPPSAGATDALTAGQGLAIPTSFTPTHQTEGLGGFPAVDIMAKPGTPILAPEDGWITRISGHEPSQAPPLGQGGPWGLSIYFIGKDSGNTYYMTHLLKVARPGGYKKGQVIGVVGDYPGSKSDHVHVGIHHGKASEAYALSGSFDSGDFLPGGGGSFAGLGQSDNSATGTTDTTTTTTLGGTGGARFIEKPGKAKHHADPIATFRAQLKTAVSNINDDVDKGLLPKSIGDRLEQRADAIRKSLEHATKADIPKIRTQMRDLNAAVTAALRATRDQALLGRDEKQIRTDVKDGLLSKEVGASLIAQAEAINRRLVKDIFDPKRSAADDQAARGFRARIAAMLAQATEARQLGIDLKDIDREIEDQLNEALGKPVKHATAAAVAAARAGIARIRAEFAANKVIPKAEQTRLKQQVEVYKKTIEDGITGMVDAVNDKKSRLETAWGKLADDALSKFDSETSKHLSSMQKTAQKALDALQVTVQGSGFANFLFGGSLTKTPTQLLLEQRAKAKQTADNARSIADAEKQLAAAQAALAAFQGGGGVPGHPPVTLGNGDTVTGTGVPGSGDLASLQQAVADAQKALDDARYQQETDDLQDQADLEEQAAQDQLDAAKQHAQDLEDQAESDYQNSRDAQRKRIEQMFADELDAIESGKKTIAEAMAELGDALGMSLADSFAAWFDPANPASVTSSLAAFLYAVNIAKGQTPSKAAVNALAALPPASYWWSAPAGDPGTGFNDPTQFDPVTGIPIVPRGGKWAGAARGGWAGRIPLRIDARDTIPTMLRRGEYVMSPEEVAAGAPSWARGNGGIGDVYLDGRKVGVHVARHVTNEQERTIGYPSSRA